jgi:hypothetical protein
MSPAECTTPAQDRTLDVLGCRHPDGLLVSRSGDDLDVRPEQTADRYRVTPDGAAHLTHHNGRRR